MESKLGWRKLRTWEGVNTERTQLTGSPCKEEEWLELSTWIRRLEGQERIVRESGHSTFWMWCDSKVWSEWIRCGRDIWRKGSSATERLGYRKPGLHGHWDQQECRKSIVREKYISPDVSLSQMKESDFTVNRWHQQVAGDTAVCCGLQRSRQEEEDRQCLGSGR